MTNLAIFIAVKMRASGHFADLRLIEEHKLFQVSNSVNQNSLKLIFFPFNNQNRKSYNEF